MENTHGTKEGITNNTNHDDILTADSDSPMTIELLMITHQSEMVNVCILLGFLDIEILIISIFNLQKKMMKKVDSLESNVHGLNDRVGRQENEIVALKSIVNQQKKREKRETKFTPLCSIRACAFDTKGTSSSVDNKKPANCEDLKSLRVTL